MSRCTVGIASAALLLLACSNNQRPHAEPAPSATPTPPAMATPAADPDPTPDELPLPQDFAAEAAAQITNANFHAELDALQKEISAEN